MNKTVIFGSVVIIGLASGGCSSTPLLTLEGLTEEKLTKIAFPAPDPRMKLLRSKYIAAALGLYGAWAVKEHSRENLESDSDTILRHLNAVEKSLASQWATVNVDNPKDDFHKRFNYTVYVHLVFRLIKAATNPAKRRYRAGFLSAITSSNPIAIAKTAFLALKNILEIGTYKKVIASDARDHAVKIFSTGKLTGKSGSWDEFRKKRCDTVLTPSQNPLGPPTWFPPTTKSTKWWDRLPEFVQDDMCNKLPDIKRKDIKAWISAAVENRMSALRSRNKTEWEADWKQVDVLFQRACKRLSELAETTNPCVIFE